jgi:hypothetical chaperone protein
VQLELDRLAPPVVLDLNRDQFDGAIDHLVGSVETTVNNLLRDAGVGRRSGHGVLHRRLQRRALLRERIGALVPKARKVEGDLFGSIGAGLALDAVRKFG